MKTEIYFAMSRKVNRAQIMTGFVCWEHLQGALMCGIRLSDGTIADAIGRCKDVHAFLTKAEHGGTTVVFDEGSDSIPAKFEIVSPNGGWIQVAFWTFRSWTGKRRIDGKRYHGPVFTLGTYEVAA